MTYHLVQTRILLGLLEAYGIENRILLVSGSSGLLQSLKAPPQTTYGTVICCSVSLRMPHGNGVFQKHRFDIDELDNSFPQAGDGQQNPERTCFVTSAKTSS